jgi:hypothetical protein
MGIRIKRKFSRWECIGYKLNGNHVEDFSSMLDVRNTDEKRAEKILRKKYNDSTITIYAVVQHHYVAFMSLEDFLRQADVRRVEDGK